MITGKRKPEEMENDAKKPKKENCPHAEKCYRRNPHHFKEYEHPHLTDFIQADTPATFPTSFTQDKQVYVEQLMIIRELNHLRLNNSSAASAPAVVGKKRNDMPSLATPPKRRSLLDVATASTSTLTSKKVDVKKDVSVVVNSKKSCNTMKEKLEMAHPYNIFFTKVPKAHKTLEPYNCISFPDLVCPSLGELKSSLQINFMIDVMWLNEQYQVHGQGKKPMTVLYGYEFPNMEKYMDMKLKNVTYKLVDMKDPFGTHHSKVGIYTYEDGSIRVVVSTANLYYEDWNHYNQGLWVSPRCPKMDDSKQDFECSGPTGFKQTLISYLNTYNLAILKDWIQTVKRADFSDVRVHLITSTPGKHYPKDTGCHLHQVGGLLSKHCNLPAKTTPQSEGPLSWGVIIQASSIGTLGKTAGDWLRTVLLRSLGSHKQSPLPSNSNATLSLVYPSAANVMYSHFGAEGGGCLPYAKTVNEKQKWLKDYFHQWKADRTGRSKAMPHMKSYCRVSPCLTKLAYFLLTSANISKSAWGGNIQKDHGCYVRSYEVGVLFLPSFFDEEHFVIDSEDSSVKLFPFMYDLPLTPYASSDEAWCN